MSIVEMKSVGPISSITFEMDENSGGVKVLRGTSGVGKSTALRVLSGLIGDKSALTGLTPHDGSPQGEVTGLGRKVKIGQKTSSTGSANVPHISGLDVSVLVDPKVADPAARTKARVRCLVSVGGKQVKPEDLLGDQYNDLSELIDIDEAKRFDDPVAMADYLKRALDKAALEKERESDRKSGEAEAKRREAGDIDSLVGDVTYADAVSSHRKAMQAVSDAKQQQSRYRTVKASNETTASQIAELESSITESIEDMRATLEKKKQSVEGLRARYEAAKTDHSAYALKLAAAEKDTKRLESLRGSIVEVGTDVTDESIAELEQLEAEALERLNNANTLTKRKDAFNESLAIQKESSDLATKSMQLRAAASSVQNEVQKALPSGPIRVEDGVLVVQQDKRGKLVPLEALSTGEKWRIAMEYAIAAVGKGGVFPLDQEAWQSLGPELKDEIALQCKAACVWLITGEIGEGSLRVEEYGIKSHESKNVVR